MIKDITDHHGSNTNSGLSLREENAKKTQTNTGERHREELISRIVIVLV